MFHDLHSLISNAQPIDISRLIIQNKYLRKGDPIENQLVNELKETTRDYSQNILE